MDLGGTSWAIMNVVGPLLIVIVLAWAFLRNKKNRSGIDRTERATRELYEQEEAERRSGHDHKG
ncbi:MAG TPA: hypothetical protein VGB62_00940 [Allosphingosinicella sp.]|jgi:hypothetical protein